MLTAITSLFAPKMSVRILIRGLVSDANFHLQVSQLARNNGLVGVMRVEPNRQIELQLEGPKPRIDALVSGIQRAATAVFIESMQVTWGAYRQQFHTFRVGC